MGAFDDLIPPAPGGLTPLTQPKPADPTEVLRRQRLEQEIAAGNREAGTAGMDQRLKELEIAKREAEVAKAGTASKDLDAARAELTAVINAAKKAKGLSAQEWFATGFGAKTSAEWGGTAAADVQGLVNTIAANTAFEKLAQMRRESPTGGALGNVTEKELDLLRDSIASIGINQSDTQFQASMDAIIDRYQKLYDKIGAPEAAKGTPTRPSAGDIGFAGARAEPTGFTPEQQSAYDLFLANNPGATPDQINEFGRSIGITIHNAEEVVRARSEGLGVRPASDAVVRPPDISDVRGNGEIIDPFLRGTADTLTLGLSDELGAVVDTVGRGGTYAENLARERAIADYDEENNFGLRLAGQFAGGVALPTGGASSAAQLARVGAGYGGAYGLGSGESTTDRLIGAGFGAATGAAAGAAFGLIGNHVASRGGGPGAGGGRSRAVELAEAAANQSIDLLPADVGGPFTRRLTAGAAQSPISAGSIIRAGQRTVDQAHGARDRIAASTGQAVDPVDAGEAAARGAQSYISGTSGQGGRLYERADALAGGARIDPVRAREILDRNLAELGESPMGAPQALTSLRERLEGQFTVSGLRQLRTQLRDEFAAQGLRGSDAERRGMQAVDALTEDIATGLTTQGNAEAAQAYKSADDFWRERLRTIDETLAPIIGRDGNRSGEQVFEAIQSTARSDARRLKAFMRAIPEDEQATVRATIIGQLGRSSAGRQNAEGSGFSLAEFGTHWNKMTPRAKETLFSSELRSALDDIAKVAEASKQAASYANRSNTSGSQLGNILTGGAGVAAWFEPIVLTGLAANYGAGRLLASPRFARWLARPPKSPGTAARRLGRIATQEPALAADIAPIQRALESAMPLRAAASEERD
jgi:hypothetical protein